MITGGTTPFPIWSILLTIAIPLTALTIAVGVKVWRTKGFAEPSKRRVVFWVLTGLVAINWIGYGVASNERWASRAMAVDVMNAFEDIYDDKPWPRVGDGGGGCPEFAGFAQVLAESSTPIADFDELGATELSARFVQIETAITRLEQQGFAPERTIISTPGNGPALPYIIFARGDGAASALVGGAMRVEAGSATCNGRMAAGTFRQFQVATVDEFTLENVCAADPENRLYPIACGQQ